MMNTRKSVLTLAGLCTLITMAVFQNCSPGGSAVFENSSRLGASSVSPGGVATGGSSTNYDFVNYGDCGVAGVEVQTEITLSRDMKTAEIIKQNCVPVSEPVDPNSLEFATGTTNTFMYQGLIFDLQTGAPQRLTSEYCMGASLDVAVWSTITSPTALMAQVTLTAGSTTGALTVTQPTPGNYNSGAPVNGAAVMLNTLTDSVTYSINGTSQTNSAIACYDQPMP